MSGFIPLRVRSHGSLLLGTASPETLVGRALETGCTALALTDRDNLYLAIRFYQHAHEMGLAPLIGAEVTARSSRAGATADGAALLIALDRRGYANLCRILTLRHLDPAFDLVAVLAELHPGLHVIVESAGLLGSLAAAGVPPAHGATIGVPAPPRSGAGGLWLGMRGLPGERKTLGAAVAAARWLGVPLVATGDVAMRAAADHDAHRAAVTAAAGELLERMPAHAFAAPEAWFVPPAIMERRVRAVCDGAGLPALADPALANNRDLVSRCRLTLDLGTPIFPHAPLPDGATGPGYLRGLCDGGATRRYRDSAPDRMRAARRLDEELAIIDRLGFTDYFLLVADIVEFARAHGIPTVGRGSGAGSIVAYVLGITNVDPLRYGLYFERFLHPQRRDCPDLDIDLCWQRRDQVIQHVYDTYGADRVAMISTHATLGARSAFRETAKILGVPNTRVNALAKRVPHELEPPWGERLRALPAARDVDWREPVLAEALRLAEQLDGAPRHLSIHAGGVVIGDRPLTHYVPLERAAKGIVVTQFEMRAIEAVGLVKMDLLGNRALTEIGECVELVRRHQGIAIDVDRLPDPDPATARALAEGDTLNCFQLESPAMRHLLRMLDARTLDDTIAAVALVRPGPSESGMKEVFCRRQRGLEPAAFLHPRLEPVLRGTHGVLLYEEDVMCVASALAGLSLAEGDQLRRAIGAARGDEEFRALEGGFVGHCARAGVDADTARAAWRELTRFAAYGFCKAHAAGYGVLGYQATYLKQHHPAAYAVGVLNHHAGMYATWVHVEDLRRHGVTFHAPCIRRSEWESTLEHGEVRVGLSRVFGLAEATGDRIVAARAARPFTTLADVVDRVRPTLPELEMLIQAGALDATGRTRPSLLLEARVGERVRPVGRVGRMRAPDLVATDGSPLAPEPVAPLALPRLPEFGAPERVRGELQATGLWFSGHPLDAIDPALVTGTVPAASLPRHGGRRITVLGLPCASRGVETKKGERMHFMTLADRSGLAECVFFPDAWRHLAPATRGDVLRVEGRVDETLGAFTINVEHAESLAVGAATYAQTNASTATSADIDEDS
jgi:DNA-directed DNA polymerase III PolC